MTIEARLFATLREGRGKVLKVELGDGATVADLAGRLSIDRKDVAILLVGGRDARLDRPLSDGEIVSIFPPVGGG
ncbi:MAG: molybdopterin synthase sulfur carrier subunit [Spirochaetae bacterium HGW-Spirochaetae-3]|jgi:molybdopterin converting factor small subunit|nr:MAG: molybdopterin synthase sulfur carrier subunit [Spirochaetae bacterium HGW-Spirochaetae-3]